MKHSFLVQIDLDDDKIDVQKIAEKLFDAVRVALAEQNVKPHDYEANYLGSN